MWWLFWSHRLYYKLHMFFSREMTPEQYLWAKDKIILENVFSAFFCKAYVLWGCPMLTKAEWESLCMTLVNIFNFRSLTILESYLFKIHEICNYFYVKWYFKRKCHFLVELVINLLLFKDLITHTVITLSLENN